MFNFNSFFNLRLCSFFNFTSFIELPPTETNKEITESHEMEQNNAPNQIEENPEKWIGHEQPRTAAV